VIEKGDEKNVLYQKTGCRAIKPFSKTQDNMTLCTKEFHNAFLPIYMIERCPTFTGIALTYKNHWRYSLKPRENDAITGNPLG
jgi:hypothetical protein